ncbi:MAG TPA: hypothetical protein PK413_17545 [Thermoanaerobaculia bacterium]|nr:hypothetical protein [Thermoanaerobaculia bacterium]
MSEATALPRLAVRLALAALPGWRLAGRGRSLAYQGEMADRDRALALAHFAAAACFRRVGVRRLLLAERKFSLEIRDLTTPAVTSRLLAVAEQMALNLALFAHASPLAELPPPSANPEEGPGLPPAFSKGVANR